MTGRYDIQLKHLNEKGEAEETQLTDGAYALEQTTPCVIRVWGTWEKQLEMTLLIPLERVISLATWIS